MRSPGGYETWRWQAFDSTQRIYLCVEFWQGHSFDADYRQAYHRYLSRPTRIPPPTPNQYPRLVVTLLENEILLARQCVSFAPAKLNPGSNGLIVELATNRARLLEEGIEIDLNSDALTAHLLFTGKRVPGTPMPTNLSQQKHFEFAMQPLCPVVGTIAGNNSRPITFAGHGISHYCFGTEPLGLLMDFWMRGCLLSENILPAFVLSVGHGSPGIDASNILPLRDGKHRSVLPSVSFESKWLGKSAYPSSIEVAPDFLLRNPRPIGKNGPSGILIYDAFLEGEQTQALLEIVHVD
jgi:hypothetical protein